MCLVSVKFAHNLRSRNMNSSDVVNDDPEILPQSHGTLFPSISLVLQATSLGKTA